MCFLDWRPVSGFNGHAAVRGMRKDTSTTLPLFLDRAFIKSLDTRLRKPYNACLADD